MIANRQRKRGRPALPPEERRLPGMTFRPTPGLRSRIEDAAEASERTMSQEIEWRLDTSFFTEDTKYKGYGGPGGYDMAHMLATLGKTVGSHLKAKQWWRDPAVLRALAEMVPSILEALARKLSRKRSLQGTITMTLSLDTYVGKSSEDPRKLSKSETFLTVDIGS